MKFVPGAIKLILCNCYIFLNGKKDKIQLNNKVYNRVINETKKLKNLIEYMEI